MRYCKLITENCELRNSQNESYLEKEKTKKPHKTNERVSHNTNEKLQNESYLLLFVFLVLASKKIEILKRPLLQNESRLKLRK